MPERPAYVIVVGGGKVGFYLTHRLLTAGYEVALIEKDRVRAASISAQLGSCACLVGDGDEMAFLATSGIERADVLAAVTGDDEDNLVACQLAKRKFKVPHTIARVNNPSNVQLFHRLGVDVAVSATELILNEIDTALATDSDIHRMPLEGTEAALVRITVPLGPAVGHPFGELRGLGQEKVLLLVRDGHQLSPETPLLAGDQIVIFTTRPSSDFLLEEAEALSQAAR
ncbi:MAG TPA: TrkA family potassium uptake protein [Candidatus Nanopelagicaceae bacterium]|nr:TrkA family potassium uptake protein [Candidatus Nanopelagicaceae bacterium]